MRLYQRPVFSRHLLICTLFLTLSGCFLSRKNKRPLPFETVEIPGGVFRMGDVFEEKNTDAIPTHRSVVAPFEMSVHEITYAAYDSFAVATNTSLPSDDGYGRGTRAVVNITWEAALAFCTHYGFRLPTEAEWEYAARDAGQHYRYAGTDDVEVVDNYVRHIENSVLHSFQVGSKEPNQLGLYDMSGNVYEWIGDYYEFYPKAGEKPAYKSFENSSMRIIRGGSFKQPAVHSQTYWRSGTLADFPSNAVGFRCAKSLLD